MQARPRKQGSFSGPQGLAAVSSEELFATIERELIPRLVLAHRDESVVSPMFDQGLPPTPEEIAAFVEIALTQDLSVALDQIALMVARGLSTEMLLLNFIAPAAKLLGEHWDTDFKTFTEVTTGLGTLQRVVQSIGSSFAPKTGHRGLVMLTAAQGEQHTLGLFLVGEFLQRSGWGVDLVPGLNADELVDLVSSSHVEMVGITVSSQKLLGPLGRMITMLKRHSQNPRLRVVVGGSIDLSEFASEHQLPLLCGPQDAVRWLEENVSALRPSSLPSS